MYRNVVYNIDTENGWQGEIILYTWDENGNRIHLKIPHQSYLYYKDDKGSYKSIFNEILKKRYFKSTIDRKKWIEANPNEKIYECLSGTSEFLINYFYKQNEDMEEFAKYPLYIGIIDIEIAVEDEFPNPQEAKYPVNLITVYDSFDEKYYTWVLNKMPFDPEDDDIVIKFFDSEYKLLADFFNFIKQKRYDILSGWNSFGFDIPTLINRGYKLFGEEFVNDCMSPIKKVRKKDFIFRADGNFYSGYKIEGLCNIDYMLIYKKFINAIEGEKASYSLENIGQDELGYGKIKYEGNMRDLYKTDFKKFVQYNKHDVKLIVEIDKKRKLFNLMRFLCNFALSDYESIYSNLTIILNSVIQQSRINGDFIPYVRQNEHEHEDKVGAFVFEPELGRYDKGVVMFDVKSLYPNTMITLNISPEKLVGKIVEETDDNKIIRLVNGKTVKINNEKFNKLLESDYSLASNKTIYECKTPGILPAFLDKLFKKRVSIQKEIKAIKKKEVLTEEDRAKISNLDLSQISIKTVLNSVYGTCGTPYSPWYNKDTAEAITMSGQTVTKSAMKWIEDKLIKDYNHNPDKRVVVGGDTDSIAIDIESVSRKVLGPGVDICHKTVRKVDKELELIRKDLNKWCEEYISKQIFHGIYTDRINFEREIICDIAFFFKKKRYLCHVIDKEGELVDELKCRGIALRKSNYPPLVKGIMREVFEKTIKERWTQDDLYKYLDSKYNEFTKCSFEEISTIKNLNSLKEPESFMATSKGTAGHAKAIIYYNQLLERLGLLKKYYIIKNNSKVRLCYINKNNRYNIQIIGFEEEFPEEFKELFVPDYEKQFKLMVLKPLQDFMLANRWSEWSCERANIETDILNL